LSQAVRTARARVAVRVAVVKICLYVFIGLFLSAGCADRK
jgi:hypothetical protein